VSSRVGILGGSFDPIHVGHLRSAEEVCEALDLERVYFMPANQPPHKPERRLADGRHRLAMIERAIVDNPAFRVSAIEIDRGGISYSIDTLESFAASERPAAVYFIVGIDTFREMQTWKEAARLFEIVNVVVTNRPPRVVERSIEHLPVAAQEAFCYDPATLSYRHRSGTRVHFLPITGIDVSATSVRERVARGQSVRYLVPPSVERYIREHHLYRSGESIG
jgi:nicotinate-nucleotide adenylyltransferase